jgi:hypothetical protein
LRILRGAARSRHVFKREFILLVDRTNMLFSQPDDGFRLQNSFSFENYHWLMQSSVASFRNRNAARAYVPFRRKINSLSASGISIDSQSMISKSMPSGFDPTGGNRFSEKIMLQDDD